MSMKAEIGLEFAFEIIAEVGQTLDGGPGRLGTRRIVPITGGTVRGPKLNGRIVPGGADYAIGRPDGAAVVTAHYALEAEDGTPIYIMNEGIRTAAPEVIARLRSGEHVDPAEYYFRSVPTFDAPEGPHGWLSDNIFVAHCARFGPSVRIRVYQVV